MLGAAAAWIDLGGEIGLFPGDLGRTNHHVLPPRQPPPAARTVVLVGSLNERLVLGHPDLEDLALRYGLFYGSADMARPEGAGATHRKRRAPGSTSTTPSLTRLLRLSKTAPAAYDIVDDEPALWSAVMTGPVTAYGARDPARISSLSHPPGGSVCRRNADHLDSSVERESTLGIGLGADLPDDVAELRSHRCVS